MLKSINIENYAIINSLQIDFDRGLSIITGETGAGKSILLGALALALGQRAENVIKNPEKNCIIEVIFALDEKRFKPIFDENDVEFETQSIFRRIISSNGKSRAFINDIPVSVSQLKAIGEHLVDIHSQHQNLLLSNIAFQMEIVDTTAKNKNILQAYQSAFNDYQSTEKMLSDFKQQAAKAKEEYDYLNFQNEQLIAANLNDANEQEELENELSQIIHAETIKTAYTNAAAILANDEISINIMLRESIAQLKKIEKITKQAENFIERLESCKIEIADVASEIERQNNNVHFDLQRQQFIENRLDIIYELQQKHRVSSIAELILLRDNIQQKLAVIEHSDSKIEELEKEKSQRFEIVQNCAQNLTQSRKKVLPNIENHVKQMLQSLGIPNATLNVTLSQREHFGLNGNDNVSFLFSANKDIAPQEIAKVASGGEISRLMLSLKSLVIENGMFPTIIFDEIDSGISGNVADKTGEIINSLAQNSQIINITHLPQIASKGKTHYFVYKEETENATNTNIRKLTNEERIIEIAKMLSGNNITNAAIENAKELLKN